METYIDYIVFEWNIHWLYCIWWSHALIILYLMETYMNYIFRDKCGVQHRTKNMFCSTT